MPCSLRNPVLYEAEQIFGKSEKGEKKGQLPAPAPPAVQNSPSTTHLWSSHSTWGYRARAACNAPRFVVAFLPSSTPAEASQSEPTHVVMISFVSTAASFMNLSAAGGR